MKAAIVAVLAWFMVAVSMAADKDNFDDANPQGKPKWKAGQATSFAIWHEGGKWHVRATAPKNELHQFGIVMNIQDGNVNELKPVRVEKKGKTNDFGSWNKERTQFKFLLTTGKGNDDGFDFDVSADASSIKFALQIDGKEVSDAVFIGGKGDRPAKATFMLPAHPKKSK